MKDWRWREEIANCEARLRRCRDENEELEEKIEKLQSDMQYLDDSITEIYEMDRSDIAKQLKRIEEYIENI